MLARLADGKELALRAEIAVPQAQADGSSVLLSPQVSVTRTGATATVQADETAFMASVHAALGAKKLQINVGDFTDAYTIGLVAAAGAGHLEFFNNFLQNMPTRWTKLVQMLGGGAYINLPTPYSDTARYSTLAGWTPPGAVG